MFSSRLDFKGAVIGMVLGDACIPKLGGASGRKTQHLQLSHCIADKQYAEYKAVLLGYLNEVKTMVSSTSCNDKDYPCVVVRTLSHPFYNSLAEHMYYDGRKTVTEHVMKCLTPLGLALWYMDDGTLAGEVGWRNPFICSHNFNEVENDLMCRMIHKKFGITFRTTKKNIKGNTYYWMRLRRKDREKFFDIIREFVPQCMLRKITPEYYENDKRYSDLSTQICIGCGEKFDRKLRSISNHCSVSCSVKSRHANTKHEETTQAFA